MLQRHKSRWASIVHTYWATHGRFAFIALIQTAWFAPWRAAYVVSQTLAQKKWTPYSANSVRWYGFFVFVGAAMQPNPTKAKQTVWFLCFIFTHYFGYWHYLHHYSDMYYLCFAAVTSGKTKGRISPAGCFIWLPQNGASYSRFLPQHGHSIPQNHSSLSP